MSKDKKPYIALPRRMWQASQLYCAESCAHGFSYLVSTSLAERLCWLAIVAASWVIAVGLFFSAIGAWAEEPLIWRVQKGKGGGEEERMEFPVVTICPTKVESIIFQSSSCLS